MNNLALVKPEKAKAVENYLIQMARLGQLGGKVRKCHLDDWSGHTVHHRPLYGAQIANGPVTWPQLNVLRLEDVVKTTFYLQVIPNKMADECIIFHVAAGQSVFLIFWQISESGLIEILEKVSQQTEKKTTVKVSLTYSCGKMVLGRISAPLCPDGRSTKY